MKPCQRASLHRCYGPGQFKANFDDMGLFCGGTQDYLARYGYLNPSKTPSGGTHVSNSYADRIQAIREFQKFSGLEVTGEIDEATILKMRQPRCGVSDKQTKSVDGPQNFVTAAFENAFQYWSKVSPLRFEETSEDADINILFAKGDHGDGTYNAFDGKGGVLGHAYFPTSGDTHFDDDEAWTYLKEGIELKTVATHEFGHALGLAHSNEPDSIMSPFYKGYDPEMKLHKDDFDGIQSLYGKPEGTTTTSSTEAPISTTETTATTRFPCDLKIDAVTDGPDGYVYFFRRSFVYKMGPEGVLPGFPRPIRSIFPGAPAKNVESAFYISSENQMVLLKGNKGWSFKGFTLEKRFNISIKSQAAIAIRRDGSYSHQVYLFQGENFYELNYKTLELVPGYPLSTRTYWSGIPLNIEAGMQLKDNNLLLFKGNGYLIFDSASKRILPGYPKPIVKDWLGQTC